MACPISVLYQQISTYKYKKGRLFPLNTAVLSEICRGVVYIHFHLMCETEKDSVTSIDSVIKIFYTVIILVLEILLDFSTMRTPCLNIQCKRFFSVSLTD